MRLGWEVWLSLLPVALAVSLLMTMGVLRLRARYGSRWTAVSWCFISFALGLGASIGSLYLAYQMDSHSRTMKNPSPPAHLSPDWGAAQPATERTQLSQSLASGTFVNWGMSVNYFDSKGILRPYQPTDNDRASRAILLRYIELTEESRSLFMLASLGWILLPWLGLMGAFTPWAAHGIRALTNRSKTDAPQPRRADELRR
jgi:hypothetical protein